MSEKYITLVLQILREGKLSFLQENNFHGLYCVPGNVPIIGSSENLTPASWTPFPSQNLVEDRKGLEVSWISLKLWIILVLVWAEFGSAVSPSTHTNVCDWETAGCYFNQPLLALAANCQLPLKNTHGRPQTSATVYLCRITPPKDCLGFLSPLSENFGL